MDLVSFNQKGAIVATDYLPRRDADYKTWTDTFLAVLTASPSAYPITTAQLDRLAELTGSFNAAFQRARAKETRGGSAVFAKDTARSLLTAEIRTLVRIIQASPTVSDQMRYDLGITVPKPEPTPVPDPTERPRVDIESVIERTVNALIHSATTRGKEAGTQCAWVYSFVGDDYPSDPTHWQFQGATTRARHSVTFPSSVPAGAKVWICAAWVNAKGVSGPISAPVPINLQGGGVNSPTAMKLAA